MLHSNGGKPRTTGTRRVLLVLGIVCLTVGLVVTVAAAGTSHADSSTAGPNATLASADDTNQTSQTDESPDQTGAWPADPSEDRLGWEQGYWYNESIDVDQTDGLSDAELQRYKARTMARLEHIRGLEFEEDVEIEFIGPEEVSDRLDRDVTQFRGSAQQWEALFVIGEDRNASEVIHRTLVGNVGGWAAEEGSDTVVLITENPGEPTAPPMLMAHELVHVLQHQQFDLWSPRYERGTMDGEHAKDAVVEGEASFLDSVYTQYCSNGSWECVGGGSPTTGPGTGEFGLFPYLGAPYSLGSEYVGELVAQGGFDAVDAVHQNPPNYSVAAFHVGESVEPSEPLTVPDRSSENWTRADHPDRVGAMGLRAFAGDVFTSWRNGALYPYTNGTAGGYVWETRWATADAAEGFAEQVRKRIRNHGGSQVSNGHWRIPESSAFGDAFAINRTDTTVRVVNAPTLNTLSEVHAGSSPENTSGTDGESKTVTTRTDGSTCQSSGSTAGQPDGSTACQSGGSTVGQTDGSTPAETAADDGPGFGIFAALVGLLLVAIAKGRAVSGRGR